MEPAPLTTALPCPRCSKPVSQEFYGPCENCRSELRNAQCREPEQLEAARYEPSMHVTPNAVALKEPE